MIKARCLALALALAVSGGAALAQPAAAPSPIPQNEQEVQDQLKSFDPAAVAAARHYYESPKVKEGMLSMLRSVTPAVIANQEKIKGASLSPEDKQKLVAALDKAMSQNFDFLLGLNMVAALQVLSKEQLVALDNFYSSPVGQGILTKMPQIGQRLPGIMRVFMPRFMGSLQNEIKASGVGAQ